MKHVLIFAAFTASAVSAQPDTVTAAGEAVRSAYGETWATAAAPKRAPAPTEVMFEFDGTGLTAQGREVLDEVARRYFEGDVQRLLAIAHADRLGAPGYNVALSMKRAQVVREYLEAQGILPSVIDIEALGAGRPVSACGAMGEERRDNAKLVACLQPDRRVVVEAVR